MKASADAQFFHDLETFSLRFVCDQCLYFCAEAQTCAHEWPTDEHRLPVGEVVIFCKEFELA